MIVEFLYRASSQNRRARSRVITRAAASDAAVTAAAAIDPGGLTLHSIGRAGSQIATEVCDGTRGEVPAAASTVTPRRQGDASCL